MGLYAGITRGLSQNLLAKRQQDEELRMAVAGVALQNALNADLDPAVRAQFSALLRGTPYEQFANIDIPETPEAKIRRRLGPLIAGVSAASALGQAGALTPDLAGMLEGITGESIFTRKKIPAVEAEVPLPQPGMEGLEAPRPGQKLRTERVTYAPEREEIDVSRFQRSEFMVQLADGRSVRASDLKDLPGALVMTLVRGARGPARSWGEFMANAVRPEFANAPVEYNDDGSIKWLPNRAYKSEAPQPTPGQKLDQQKAARQQKAIDLYSRTLAQTRDPAKAWLAASGIDPVTFKPDLPSATEEIRIAEYRVRQQATTAFVNTRQEALRQGASIDDANRVAYETAIGIDPSFPSPATLVKPESLSPQQATWAKFFRGDQLTPQEDQFIRNQVERDPDLKLALDTIGRLGNPANLTNPTEKALHAQAVATVADRMGVDISQVQQAPWGKWDSLLNILGLKKAPTSTPSGGAPDARSWADQQFAAMQQRGAKTKTVYQRIFNQARKSPNASQVPIEYWRALQAKIAAMR